MYSGTESGNAGEVSYLFSTFILTDSLDNGKMPLGTEREARSITHTSSLRDSKNEVDSGIEAKQNPHEVLSMDGETSARLAVRGGLLQAVRP